MKGILFFLSLVFFQLTTAKPAQACQCSDSFDIMQYSAHYLPLRPMIIAKAKIVQVKNTYGTQLQIIRSYVGAPNDDTVVAWGSLGDDCREKVLTRFYAVGDTVIVILFPNMPAYPPYELSSDYYISMCGSTHLKVKGDSVIGGKRTSHFTYFGFPLDKFEDSLVNLIASLRLGISTASFSQKLLTISPNSFSSVLYIGAKASGIFSIFSTDAKLLYKKEIQHGSTRHDLSFLSIGNYFGRFQAIDGRTENYKLQKQ